MRLQLVGGAYQARSVIANAIRCINYYPELNRRDSPVPMTYYQRPGLTPLIPDEGAAGVRGLYRASNGQGYCVIGQNVYHILPDWTLTLLGVLGSVRTNPVSFTDNGIEITLVDGSLFGYTINLLTNVFSAIVDPTGTFQGADRVDFIDTFTVWNLPGTNQFGSTLSNMVVFDALYTAGKIGWPDPLVVPFVNRHQIVLLGTLKSEIWYNAGAAQFPFAILPGAYIEHGCVAKYSPAAADIELFWLGNDLQGKNIVFALKGYDTRRISNHALEFAMEQMADTSDAIGMTYQLGGHVFYMLVFPSANQTWVYDVALGEDPTLAWHQEAWSDENGNFNRHRINCVANLYGKNVAGDWENGTIYELDPTVFTDTVAGTVYPLACVKGFPHMTEVRIIGQPEPKGLDGRRLQFKNFKLDLEVGTGALQANGDPPQVWLRTSQDKGRTFFGTVMQSAGAIGEYLTLPTWQPLGIARDMVFEVGHSINGPVALNSAWVDATELVS